MALTAQERTILRVYIERKAEGIASGELTQDQGSQAIVSLLTMSEEDQRTLIQTFAQSERAKIVEQLAQAQNRVSRHQAIATRFQNQLNFIDSYLGA